MLFYVYTDVYVIMASLVMSQINCHDVYQQTGITYNNTTVRLLALASVRVCVRACVCARVCTCVCV